MNTDYGIRPVTGKELVEAFGTAERALEATGGDEAVALFYLNNADRIATAPPSGVVRESALAVSLRALARGERDDALAALAKQEHASMEKPSITAVAERIGVGWKRAKALLLRSAA